MSSTQWAIFLSMGKHSPILFLPFLFIHVINSWRYTLHFHNGNWWPSILHILIWIKLFDERKIIWYSVQIIRTLVNRNLTCKFWIFFTCYWANNEILLMFKISHLVYIFFLNYLFRVYVPLNQVANLFSPIQFRCTFFPLFAQHRRSYSFRLYEFHTSILLKSHCIFVVCIGNQFIFCYCIGNQVKKMPKMCSFFSK